MSLEKPLAGTNPMLHFQIRAPSTAVRPPATLFHGLLGMSLAAGVASAQTDLGSDDIDRIARSVVRVVALQAGEEVFWGSGTVVDRGGLIFTNRHVVEGAEDYRVEILQDPNELPVPRYRARVLGYSMDVDFALLQVDRDDLA